MKHPVIGLLPVMILLLRLLGSTTAFADSNVSDENIRDEGRWYVGPRVGLSRFTGIVGLEIQKDHFGLTVGLPTRLGLKYYFSPIGSSGFVGAFAGRYSYRDNNEDVEIRTVGIGSGFRWRWRDAWDLALGVNGGFKKKERETSFTRINENVIFIGLDITVGYSF